MITIKCLNTGSKGNCYILEYNSKKIIIECGIKYSEILNELNNFEEIEYILISHSHTDHDKKEGKKRVSEKFEESLVKVFSPKNAKIGVRYKFNNSLFIPLPCKHNVDCYGYYLEIDNKKILFATDTQYLPMLNVICDYYFVEVNYETEKLDKKMEIISKSDDDNIGEVMHFQNVYFNHHSLETANDYFEYITRNGQKPKGIYTIHASMSGILDFKNVENTLSKYCSEIKVLQKGDIICLN